MPEPYHTRLVGEFLVRTVPRPQAGWTRAAPRARGEGCAAVPCLPCSSLEPRAWSCTLLPCLQAQMSPRALLQETWHPWALAVGQRGLATPRRNLPVALSEPQPHRTLAGRWELPGEKGVLGAGTGADGWLGRVRTSPVLLCFLS